LKGKSAKGVLGGGGGGLCSVLYDKMGGVGEEWVGKYTRKDVRDRAMKVYDEQMYSSTDS